LQHDVEAGEMTFGDLFAAFRWWAALMLIGAAATPFAYYVLGRLPDRGYAFVKLIGLLIVSYIFWLLGSLGFLNNNLGGILLALVILVGLSAWSFYRQRSDEQDNQSVISWIKEHWRYVLVAELVFAVIFILWTWVRAQNPAITGTEKPMEFAFLNSIGRSPDFPPSDPWLSGFAISYYYFGYVMTSLVTRLAAVPEAVGFNLGLAWLVAATALGAFGLVYNLIMSSRGAAKRSAVIFAVIAAVAIPIAGNLEIAAEIFHSESVGSADFWEWLDIRDLDEPPEESAVPRYETSQWWWWRSSRVIHEYTLAGREEAGLEPIAEFPGFSFVLGDLHSHVLSLPFAFLSLVVALNWWLHPGPNSDDGAHVFKRSGLRALIGKLKTRDGSLLLFTILLLGGLSFLNTWDVLIHMFVIVAAFMLGRWRQLGHWQKSILWQGIVLTFILIIGSLILYLPFYLGFRSQAGPPFLLPMIMRPTRLAHIAVIFGMPLIGVVALLVALSVRGVRRRSAEVGRRYWLWALGISLGIIVALVLLMTILGLIIATSDESRSTIMSLAADLDRVLPVMPSDPSALTRFRWAIAAVSSVLPPLLITRIPDSALIVFLSAMIFLIIYLVMRMLDRDFDPLSRETPSIEESSHFPSVVPFVLLLVLTGTLLILGPEFVYLKDNFGQRLNTIFKFYYQAWVLFGVVALFGLDYLLRNFRVGGILATGAYGVALIASLLFPYYAIQSRAVEYRGPADSENRAPATLNGLSHVGRYNPDELEAITWLQDNADGMPVILEAVGGQYTNFGRISASTGFPTVLGWAGHEYQWRGTTSEPAQRDAAVEDIYVGLDWARASALLDEYGVEFVYLGSLEKNTYSPRSEVLFDQYLDLAYQNGSVKIYRWNPSS
jgi:YYY domain-containing protein